MREYNGSILIEIMLATTMGMLLLFFLSDNYIRQQQSYRLQSALSRLQNNADLAIKQLRSEVHQAGAIGCMQLSKELLVIEEPPYAINAANKLVGTDNDITIRHGGKPVYLQSKSGRDEFIASQEIKFVPGDIILLTNCQQAELARITHSQLSGMNQHVFLAHSLHELYEAGSEVSRLIQYRFFTAKTKRVDATGMPIIALFREDIHGRKTELVPGISQLRFQYMTVSNGINMLQNANQIDDWSSVVGVMLSLHIMEHPLKKTRQTFISLFNRS